MNDTTKREMLRRYFAPPPPKPNTKPAYYLLFGGILFLIVGISWESVQFCIAIGAVGLILAIIWLVALYTPKKIEGDMPTDAQVDQWLQEDLEPIIVQSINKLGLDETQIVGEPLLIRGPILWSTTGVPSDELLWKRGNDGIARFAIHRVTVIHLTDQMLGAYAADFNFLRNVALNEQTDEFHYRDIVSVSTQEVSTSYTLPSGVSLVNAQAFRLAVASGDKIQVAIGAEKLAEITGGQIPTTGAEKAVQVIRAMLREKKG